jgi:hypothetical protein
MFSATSRAVFQGSSGLDGAELSLSEFAELSVSELAELSLDKLLEIMLDELLVDELTLEGVEDPPPPHAVSTRGKAIKHIQSFLMDILSPMLIGLVIRYLSQVAGGTREHPEFCVTKASETINKPTRK